MWISRYAVALICAAAVAPVQAFAAGSVKDASLLDTLNKDHVITASQYKALKKKETKIEHKHKYLPHLIGYAQVDFPLSVSHGGYLGSSTLLRRLYLGAKGKIGDDWKYKGQFGFINGKAGVSSAVLSYVGVRRLAITAGYMKEPFSLDYMTSPKNLAFTERALPIALVPGKKIGLMLKTHGRRWTVAGGIFGAKYNKTPSGDPGGNANQARYGSSLRATLAPVDTHGVIWEVGGSGAWREADSDHTYKFKAHPEERTVGAELVSTGSISNVNSVSSYGAESGLYAGPVSLQGEYVGTQVNRQSGSSNLNFNGWYAQTTWAINGRPRHFAPAKGKVVGVKPTAPVTAGGYGAWELAMRYSTVDLNDGEVAGGKERNVSFGINWYPESHVRLTVDDTRVLPIKGGKYDQVSTNIVEARTQFVF